MNNFPRQIDIKELPQAVMTVLEKSVLNKNDHHVLRQFLYKNASTDFDVSPLIEVLEEKYGRLQTRIIWSEKNKIQANLEYRVRGSGKMLFRGSKKSTHHRRVTGRDDISLDEMYHYANIVIPSEIPGCTVLLNGQNVLNNKGKRYVRWLCYVMCRLGGDPNQLIKRLEKFFDKALLSQVIEEKTIQSMDKAYQNHLKEMNGSVADGGQDDEETKELNRLIHSLSYRDIPGLETFDKWRKSGLNKSRLFSQEVITFLQDKIRRMFEKHLQFDSFLFKLADMFGSAVKLIFDEKFRQEVLHYLLPKYEGGKLKNLDQWLQSDSLYEHITIGGERKMRQIMPHFNKMFYYYFTNDDLPELLSFNQRQMEDRFYLNPEPVSFGEGPVFQKVDKQTMDFQSCSSVTIPSLLNLANATNEYIEKSTTPKIPSLLKLELIKTNDKYMAKTSARCQAKVIPCLLDLNIIGTNKKDEKSISATTTPLACPRNKQPLLSNPSHFHPYRRESLLMPHTGTLERNLLRKPLLSEKSAEAAIVERHDVSSRSLSDESRPSNNGNFVSFDYGHKRPSGFDQFVSYECEPLRSSTLNKYANTPTRPLNGNLHSLTNRDFAGMSSRFPNLNRRL